MPTFLISGFDFAMSFLGYLIPFLFVLALVVFIHEMGHFLVGRMCGVKVETFSLGFGPRIASFYDRKGTQWALSAIPLGGYVKFKGDSDASSKPDHAAAAAMSDEDKRDAFPHKAVWQRAAIVAAGPLANFLLAFVIFATLFCVFGRMQSQPIIGAVAENSAAAEAGFKPGDRVLAVDGVAIETFNNLSRAISVSDGNRLSFKVQRDANDIMLTGTPRIVIEKSVLGTSRLPMMGISSSGDSANQFIKRYSLGEGAREAVTEIAFVIDRTGNYVAGLFNGREKADQMSGPLRIAYISGKVAESGIRPLLFIAAILSISIGLINLMPIPMLDGGHLVFYAIEALTRRPVSPRAQEMSFRVGFALVLGLMLFSTWNDVLHLTGLAF